MMDFIFMLTRRDRTIDNCLEVLEAVKPLGLRHIGFKDVGAEPDILQRLTVNIAAMGATSYMEIVATDAEACHRAARLGRDIGVKNLLGGTNHQKLLELTQGSETQCYPFPGIPSGHPTRLGGSAETIEDDCRAMANAGCAGCDLLAFRATDDDPLALVQAARRGLGASKRLIVAGSVTSYARIRAIHEAGADAFTIGTAVLDGAYAPGSGDLGAQLAAVMADCAKACAA